MTVRDDVDRDADGNLLRRTSDPLLDEPDDDVRYAAAISTVDQDLLFDLALFDAHPVVRATALCRVEDSWVAEEVAYSDGEADDEVRAVAACRITDVNFLAFAKEALQAGGRLGEVMDRRCRDPQWPGGDPMHIARAMRAAYDGAQDALATLATSPNPVARMVVVRNLADQALLERAALADPDSLVRMTAVLRVQSQSVVAQVVRTDAVPQVRRNATIVLEDLSLLAEIAERDESREVRIQAEHAIFFINRAMDLEQQAAACAMAPAP